MAPKQIGIAIVEHNGCYLVGIRTAGQELAGLAEFPGGKCEPDETPLACVARECLEETGLAVEPIELLDQVRFAYPHATVELHFWICRLTSEHDQPENGFGWLTLDELQSLDFPAANASIPLKLRDRRASLNRLNAN